MTEWSGRIEVPFVVIASSEEEAREKVYHDLAFGHLSTAEALITDIERVDA